MSPIMVILQRQPFTQVPVPSGLAVVLNDGVTPEEVTALAQRVSVKARRRKGSTPEPVLNAVVVALGSVGRIVHCDLITIETESL